MVWKQDYLLSFFTRQKWEKNRHDRSLTDMRVSEKWNEISIKPNVPLTSKHVTLTQLLPQTGEARCCVMIKPQCCGNCVSCLRFAHGNLRTREQGLDWPIGEAAVGLRVHVALRYIANGARCASLGQGRLGLWFVFPWVIYKHRSGARRPHLAFYASSVISFTPRTPSAAKNYIWP